MRPPGASALRGHAHRQPSPSRRALGSSENESHFFGASKASANQLGRRPIPMIPPGSLVLKPSVHQSLSNENGSRLQPLACTILQTPGLRRPRAGRPCRNPPTAGVGIRLQFSRLPARGCRDFDTVYPYSSGPAHALARGCAGGNVSRFRHLAPEHRRSTAGKAHSRTTDAPETLSTD
jgi:hypothetical protein